MTSSRRQILRTALAASGAGLGASVGALTASSSAFAAAGTGAPTASPMASPAAASAATPSRLPVPTDIPPTLRARRLQPGDTIGLVSPANATYEREPLTIAVESLQAMGFKVKLGPHVQARYGQFGGTDAQRAGDINDFFADDSVAGILALSGGSGCNRIVDKLNYALIRRKPKFFGGFSDLTSLVNAIHRQTGLITFHSPVASSEWNEFSLQHFKAVVMDAAPDVLRNVSDKGDNLVQTEDRITTVRPGVAQGRLIGGNLTVLASLAGSPFFPDCRGALLFLEDTNEYIYRLDRCLSTLRLAGALDQLAGVVLGKFTRCGPGEGYGTLTLDEVFDDYFLPLNVPVYRGAMIGHIRRKFTVPVGQMAEIDSQAGTVRLLSSAVR
ncbi:S66 peptidase family protein [Roseateles depolymerans]|uniref:Peptidase U61 LD-carboxypeptidase A n=1 Tax=Roseateles depolymerans TaxID=76731 RepID=A0A0U3MKA7_9BURK|nr:LD-carboxypeptidase [Roseateles depolymerans]ALV04778.1 Peptidase U61 LD-carboxypeptidase A [Roseateles depolymerans]REG15211.1 muramoyltetrapeptide carboxypeptidase [Roseateles depolymerans]